MSRPRATNPWLILVLVCVAQFMVVLDATIVNVALPSIQRDLGFSSTDLQWVVNGYTLVFGGFLLLGGRAADLFGRKRLFVAGVALFTLASLANALAESPAMLVGARAVQGLGAALVSPAALSIVTTTFPEGPGRTRALSVWGAIAAGGAAAGLLIGGVLTDALSWEWNFLINVPVGVAAVAMSWRFVPESRPVRQRGGFDLAGAAMVTAGLVLLTYAIVKAEDFGWLDERTLAMGGGALLLLTGFTALEMRLRAPLVNPGIFRIRSLASSNAATLLVAGAMFSLFFFGSLYLQQVKDYDALEAGVAFLPMSALVVVGSALAQRLIRAVGVKAVLVTGLTLSAAGLLHLSWLGSASSYAGGFLPGLLLTAIGLGLAFVPLTLTATTNVTAGDQGLASGVFNTAQQIGGALGLAALSTIANDRITTALADAGAAAAGRAAQGDALVEGFTLAFTVGAGLLLASALLVAALLRRHDVAHVDAAGALAPAI